MLRLSLPCANAKSFMLLQLKNINTQLAGTSLWLRTLMKFLQSYQQPNPFPFQLFLFIFTELRYRKRITQAGPRAERNDMKLLLSICLTAALPAVALAQATPPPDMSASTKPAPFQPLVAREQDRKSVV